MKEISKLEDSIHKLTTKESIDVFRAILSVVVAILEDVETKSKDEVECNLKQGVDLITDELERLKKKKRRELWRF